MEETPLILKDFCMILPSESLVNNNRSTFQFHQFRGRGPRTQIITLPETNIAPENEWLEY